MLMRFMPTADVQQIRTGEELDTEALRRCLDLRLPGPAAAIEALQFPDGHSNLTYLIRRD